MSALTLTDSPTPKDALNESCKNEQLAEKQLHDDTANYFGTVIPNLQAFASSHHDNPDLVLLYILYFVFASLPNDQKLTSSSTMTGMKEDELGVFGKRLVVNAKITEVFNDWQTNVFKGDVNFSLQKLADETEGLIAALQGTGQSGYSGDLSKAFSDPTTKGKLIDTLTAMRKSIHTGSGALDGDLKDVHCYFDATGTTPKKLKSFDEMIKNMQTKGDSDDTKAADAAKYLSDQFNMLTSIGQSINASFNVDVSRISNLLKLIQSFLATMIKLMQEQSKAYVTNQKIG